MSDAIRLSTQAKRCFRLARGIVGPKLADELEALGRAFEQEARELELVEHRHRTWSNGDLGLAQTEQQINQSQFGQRAEPINPHRMMFDNRR
jgi:hypothetical protein